MSTCSEIKQFKLALVARVKKKEFTKVCYKHLDKMEYEVVMISKKLDRFKKYETIFFKSLKREEDNSFILGGVEIGVLAWIDQTLNAAMRKKCRIMTEFNLDNDDFMRIVQRHLGYVQYLNTQDNITQLTFLF